MLNYRSYGELTERSTPLVVLHGLLGSLDNWHTFATRYANTQPIIALDMRNHGQSPHEVGMSYQLMVDDILATLQALNIEYFDLIGHSMGGKAGMVLATQNPNLVKRLIVVDIAPYTYPPRLQPLLHTMNALPLPSLKSRKEADDALSEVVSSAFERGFLLKNLTRQQDGSFKWLCNLPEITRNYLKITGFPALIPQYTAPVLTIAGRQSDYVTEDTWAAMQTLLPQARLDYIETAGHLPHVQTPDLFEQLVREFLN
ncbi:alpha/beta fold hydrolase [Thiofilum flexile]|uniref:alpha/beta fold hydrolase n=1 Tax=Thiofilum flexile TaxID=125627 RepID=UPI00036E9025|nr:alpha/beta fold hydrolase [Thiofilum flexile]